MRQNTFQSYTVNVAWVYMKATQINMIFARKEVCRGAGIDSGHIINATIRQFSLLANMYEKFVLACLSRQISG